MQVHWCFHFWATNPFGHNYNCQPKTNKNKSKKQDIGSDQQISRPTYCVFYINVVCLLAMFDPSPGAKSKQFFAAALCDRVSPITIPTISQNAWVFFNRARMYIIHGIYIYNTWHIVTSLLPATVSAIYTTNSCTINLAKIRHKNSTCVECAAHFSSFAQPAAKWRDLQRQISACASNDKAEATPQDETASSNTGPFSPCQVPAFLCLGFRSSRTRLTFPGKYGRKMNDQ